jgi:hypothetical protein
LSCNAAGEAQPGGALQREKLDSARIFLQSLWDFKIKGKEKEKVKR